ncbi:glycogen synthase GlgA [Acidisphaera sp. S103]|uniref:glycogen synthase GlgA n=1 Tax=Acidisphaera sp. S103 TaxID=1747223 RepID=UPI001C2091C2|nr:glycogen synthase GlgA [Acidisphaera sp. S103]
MSAIKALFVTSEVAGLAKAGGLGEVSAGLPLALRRRGIDIRVLMPAYREVIAKLPDIDWFGTLPGRAGIPPARLGEARLADGTILYLVAAPSLFDRRGTPYCTPEGADWPDNHLRFARLSLAAADIAAGRGGLAWTPDIVHANDWPGGLVPAYMRWDGTDVPSILTIHNIAYQGNFDAGQRHGLGIPDAAFGMHGVEFHGRVSFLKAGGFYASHVTTVSPTHATEITTESQGAGLHGLMRTRAAAGQLSGIVNGIDESWDPGSDPHLPHHFDPVDLNGKQANADAVRTGLCLRPSVGPLFGIVSRMVHQKGLDFVAEAANDIVENGGQIAILGLGDPEIEHMLSRTSRRHRDDIGVLIGFNEPMARRIVAGSDFTLMPSRFEPCGLTQMQAQRYGALPIAHATGGLADTIDDGATGFLFSTLSSGGLVAACHRAFDVYGDEGQLADMRRAAMARCFSWSGAAAEYEALYRRLAGPRMAAIRPRPRAVEQPITACDTAFLEPAA